jgi:Fe-S-cluster containining protein
MLIDNRILYNTYTLGLMNSRYTINLPFICHQCGICCNWGYPPPKINENTLHPIRYSNNKNGKNKLMNEMIHKLMTSKPCIFYKNKACKIYPYRPKECRYYPLVRVKSEIETNEVLCPGRKRFDEIETVITQQHDVYLKETHHKKICNINTEHSPTNKQWDETVNNFHTSNPNKKEIKIFLQINKT